MSLSVASSIKVPSELFAVAESSHFEGSIAIPSLSLGPDTYLFKEKLPWEIDITNTGSALLLEGKVSGEGFVECARCLEQISYEFRGNVEGFYLLNEDASENFDEGEEVPDEDEFEVLPSNHIIDIEPLIKAALILEAPDMPLCSDDCKGLCSVCGSNLNTEQCSCKLTSDVLELNKQANPFSVLSDYKFD